MKICISNKKKNVVNAIILIIGLWYLLSLLNKPNIIPPIPMVYNSLVEILTSLDMLKNIGITFLRLTAAMLISTTLGILVGVVVLVIPKLKDTAKEMLNIFQVVPPVSVLIMAIMWFGLNGIPAVFIVTFSLIPLISIQVIEAIENIDIKLLEMAKVFNLSKLDMVFKLYVPAIRQQIFTSFTVGLTMGSKIIVMAEVLTTSTGIGGKITTARLNLEPEMVIAWTVIMVCMYYVLENVLNSIKKRVTYE